MKKLSIIVIALPFLLFVTGCEDGNEPDTLGYVVAIGIDKPEDGKEGYDFTIQFANPSKISGGASQEGGKGGKDSIENITVTAPGIYSAVNVANHIISKKFTLSHTKLLVFSDDIAKDGVEKFFETVGRSSDIRPNTYVAVSKCKAKDFLESVNPETEVNPVRYYTMIFENEYSEFIPKNMTQDFYFHFTSDERDSVMPLCSVSGKENSRENAETGYQYQLENDVAGEIPTGKEETQVMGMAVFSGDKKVAEMGEIETEIYNMIIGEYENSYVAYYFSVVPDDPITLIQQSGKKPKISIDTTEDAPKISVELYVEGDFCSSSPRISVEDNIDLFTDEVSMELKSEVEDFLKKTAALGTDIIGFSEYAKRNFPSLDKFKAYNWKEKYKNAEFNVSVDFSVRRTGLVVRSERH